MRTQFLALSALLLSAAAATAQGSGNPSLRVACPATVDLIYTQVGKLDFGGPPDPKLNISSWQPRFAPVAARLIEAAVKYGVDEKGLISGSTPDNMDAKPGDPLVYEIWKPSDRNNPAQAAHLTCEYEGGFVIQRPVPAGTRSCSVRTTMRKAAPSETTTREFITSAEFSCR
jgi:hypothetical protein